MKKKLFLLFKLLKKGEVMGINKDFFIKKIGNLFIFNCFYKMEYS